MLDGVLCEKSLPVLFRFGTGLQGYNRIGKRTIESTLDGTDFVVFDFLPQGAWKDKGSPSDTALSDRQSTLFCSSWPSVRCVEFVFALRVNDSSVLGEQPC